MSEGCSFSSVRSFTKLTALLEGVCSGQPQTVLTVCSRVDHSDYIRTLGQEAFGAPYFGWSIINCIAVSNSLVRSKSSPLTLVPSAFCIIFMPKRSYKCKHARFQFKYLFTYSPLVYECVYFFIFPFYFSFFLPFSLIAFVVFFNYPG